MRVLIAGGGTGGHLYPGIAVAEEFYKQDSKSEVLFVGTEKGIETRILPKQGYKLETIPSGGFINKDLFAKMISGVKIVSGFIRSFSILMRFKPDVVIGVGGYASVPMMSAAVMLRFPTVILEQNLIPGLANKVLSRIVDRVIVAFEGSKKFFRRDVNVFGNPVRQVIIQNEYQPGGTFTVFVFGGSQGANAINRAVAESLGHLKTEAGDIRFIHQTGEKDISWVKEAYRKAGIDAEVSPYIYNIEEAYNKADIVISRAGATTIAEITACRRPAILIPFPFAAHDHQRSNAEYLASLGIVEVILEGDLNGEKLAGKLKYFFKNRDILKKMSGKSANIYNRNAAHDIVNMCRALAGVK